MLKVEKTHKEHGIISEDLCLIVFQTPTLRLRQEKVEIAANAQNKQLVLIEAIPDEITAKLIRALNYPVAPRILGFP